MPRTPWGDRPLSERLAIVIGKAEGWDSIVVARRKFLRAAHAVMDELGLTDDGERK